MEFQDKLDRFVQTLAAEQRSRIHQVYQKHLGNSSWGASQPGRYYVRIFECTNSAHYIARYFVRLQDGAIFAAASWGTANPRRQYGTLDTIDQFDWSGYLPFAKPGSNFVMVPTGMGYHTAVPKK